MDKSKHTVWALKSLFYTLGVEHKDKHRVLIVIMSESENQAFIIYGFVFYILFNKYVSLSLKTSNPLNPSLTFGIRALWPLWNTPVKSEFS